MTQRFLLFCDLFFFHITFERCFFYIGFFHKSERLIGVVVFIEHRTIHLLFILLPYCCCCKRVQGRIFYICSLFSTYQIVYQSLTNYFRTVISNGNYSYRLVFFHEGRVLLFQNEATPAFSLFSKIFPHTKSQPVLLQIYTNIISIYNHTLYSWRTKKFYICCFLLSFAYVFFTRMDYTLYLFAIMISQLHASEIRFY